MTSQGFAPLTGVRMDRQFFRFEEYLEFDPALVVDVLQGRRFGVIFRDVIPVAAQKEMVAKFWNSPALRRRTGEPSYHVGTYHWNKPIDTYLAESAAETPHVMDVLDVTDSPWHWFRSVLAEELAREGASLRLAEMSGAKACPALIRAWNKEGDFSLEPHEDAAQCRDPQQAGFEAQQVLDYEICAVNMCIEHEEGGRLVLWNIRPDDETRRRLDIEHTGFSYPPETLTDFEQIRLDIRPGDIYVFNGRHVHAVDASRGNRTAVSFLLGYIDDRTVVTWT
ncbi:hypothetical protein ACFP2T_08205 [Plantactinospora solaniradicis]|uniref:Prolyl 4-hydroxylase alpha subunit Fe(2+) 2OG dioxygenase domain-containing protein n=1 Tax=Plantactinospora solaniradicis TaxID=1723736 RepID=A0ABW1K346_9ACTN